MSQFQEPESLFSGLFSIQSVYLIAFSWLLGQSIWQSFFSGFIAHRSLTRQAFAVLQAKTFPVYFSTSAALSALLLAVWTTCNFENIQGYYFSFGKSSVLQAWNLTLVLILSLVNRYEIGPKTNAIIVARQRLEKSEGKAYYEPGISSQMRKLNKQFSYWHGISSLANLVVIIALLYHGLWYGNFGLYNRINGVALPKEEFIAGL